MSQPQRAVTLPTTASRSMRPFDMLKIGSCAGIRSAFLIAMVLLPVIAGAECVTPSAAMAKESGALVFRGRVEGLNQTTDLGVRVTFNVDRVWTGSVSKRFDLFVWQLN